MSTQLYQPKHAQRLPDDRRKFSRAFCFTFGGKNRSSMTSQRHKVKRWRIASSPHLTPHYLFWVPLATSHQPSSSQGRETVSVRCFQPQSYWLSGLIIHGRLIIFCAVRVFGSIPDFYHWTPIVWLPNFSPDIDKIPKAKVILIEVQCSISIPILQWLI